MTFINYERIMHELKRQKPFNHKKFIKILKGDTEFMAMMYYSDVTKKYYKTSGECQLDEAKFKAEEVKKAAEEAKKKAAEAEKMRQEKLEKDEQEKRKAEIREAMKTSDEARKRYVDLLEEYAEDYPEDEDFTFEMLFKPLSSLISKALKNSDD